MIIIFNGCKTEFKPVTATSGNAKFNNCIFIGGDFMAGYSNGGLSSDVQHNSIPDLLWSKIGSLSSSAWFSHHYVLSNGYGLNFPLHNPQFSTPFHLGYKTDCLGVSSLFPLNDSIPFTDPGLINDLNHTTFLDFNRTVFGIPFAKISDYLDPTFSISYLSGGRNPYFPSYARIQGISTMIGDAMLNVPTFFTIWPGMEDVYEYAKRGGENETITDFATFDAALDKVLDSLVSKGAQGVIANIPDIDIFPFYTFISSQALVLDKSQVDSLNMFTQHVFNFVLGANGFIIGDSTLSNPYRKMNPDEYLLLSVPADSLKCDEMGALRPVPGHYVLDKYELAKINAAIQHFNSKISQSAASHNIPMVDMNSFFRQIKNGYAYDGINFSSQFIQGAFFSLDGYHPTAQGYGLLANQFILTINNYYKSTLPLIDITTLPGIIFP
jgi:hypothetical protein